MSNDIKVVLFDLGRVLMHINFDAFPNGLGLTTKQLRRQFDQDKIQQCVREYETGKLKTSEFLDLLYEIFLRKYSREKILEAFDNIIVADNQEIVPFVEFVRQEYRIAVLSNTCASHWKKVMHGSLLIKLFAERFTSFELGMMKPDTIVYKKVCSSLNVEPKEVLFIDDLRENIVGAISIGMKGILFTNAKQLVVDFQNKDFRNDRLK